ncbi:MAG: phosphatase PAP2 family protein [Bacteroidales bacterium]|nr:phosphatase PAP2 family protein [Bacteroidales bacterium]
MILYSGIVELDRAWTLALNGLHCPASDAFWLFMSEVKVWYALYVLVAALMIWRLGWKKGLLYILAAILTIVCTDQLCNLVKDSVCRLRPSSDPLMNEAGLYALQKPGRHIYGFFSGHAANAFAFATATFLALSTTGEKWVAKYGAFIYVWAFLVALSRVFCGKHFLGDILVGAMAGSVIAWMFFRLVTLVLTRRGESSREDPSAL